jgi:serine/threonine-protein kinase
VELQISSGKVLMPQLIGLPVAEAEAALKANGLTMQVVEQENSQVDPGKVTAQSEVFNSEVDQGKLVTVTVAKAPAPVPTPTPTPTPTTDTPTPKPTPTTTKK